MRHRKSTGRFPVRPVPFDDAHPPRRGRWAASVFGHLTAGAMARLRPFNEQPGNDYFRLKTARKRCKGVSVLFCETVENNRLFQKQLLHKPPDASIKCAFAVNFLQHSSIFHCAVSGPVPTASSRWAPTPPQQGPHACPPHGPYVPMTETVAAVAIWAVRPPDSPPIPAPPRRLEDPQAPQLTGGPVLLPIARRMATTVEMRAPRRRVHRPPHTRCGGGRHRRYVPLAIAQPVVWLCSVRNITKLVRR